MSLPELREPAFPIVVSGPSGVGKTVLCKGLLDRLPEITCRSISTTTRSIRPGEVEGVSYRFVSEGDFLASRDAGELAEWAEVHGRYYGTPKSFLDERLAASQSVVLNIDVQGGVSIQNCYPDAVLIFVLPPSWDVLAERLSRRGTDSRSSVEARLNRARAEVEYCPRYGYVVVNDDLDRAVSDLVAIVTAERLRAGRRRVDA